MPLKIQNLSNWVKIREIVKNTYFSLIVKIQNVPHIWYLTAYFEKKKYGFLNGVSNAW